MTQDFVFGQLRLAMVAVLAYCGGKGWLTPADSTLFLALGTSLGPIFLPWAWSLISQFGTVRISNKSAAAVVASVEAVDKTSAREGAAAAVAAVGKIAILFAFVIMSLAWSAPLFATPLKDPLNLFTVSPVAPTVAGFDTVLNKFGAKIQTVEKDLADKVIADLNAAITDATNHNDAISLPCWQANLKLAMALPAEWANPPTLPIGIALSIQIQRDLLNAITSNDPGSLKVACAALWGDQILQIGKLGLLFGFSI